MASNKNEQLSSWMDDDQHNDEFVEQLLGERELQSAYSRYRVIGEAMRDELPNDLSFDISAKVAEAIELEPAILAPQRTVTENKVDMRKRAKVVRMFKQVGQYAIAASVAAVAIIGVQQYEGEEEVASPVPVLNTKPVSGMAAPVSLAAPEISSSAQQREQAMLEQRRRINAYLQDHQQQMRIGSADETEVKTDSEEQQ